MLEIIIFTIVVFVAFIAVSFYAHYRSQKRANEFEQELNVGTGQGNPTLNQSFDAVFERVAQGDSDSPLPSTQKTIVVDTDEVVLLSDRAVTESTDEDVFDYHMDDIDVSEDILIVDDDVAFEKNMEKQHLILDKEIEEENKNDAEVKSNQATQDNWDLVLSLTVLAPEGELFSGRAIKSALESQDLHFGDFQLYHKYFSDSRKILFSVANIVEPGTLIPNSFVSMNTPGLLLFTRLPHFENGMTLFDDLLSTTQEVASRLNGIVCDDRRQLLNDSDVELMRRRIMEYQMNAEEETTQIKNDQIN